jgi:hypothetical protein
MRVKAFFLSALLCATPLAALLRQDAQPFPPAVLDALSAVGGVEGATSMRCSSRNAVGVGLKGDYFSQPALKGEVVLSRIDSTVDFDESLEWPADRSATRPLSVRWQGWVKVPLSGRYRFHGGPAANILVSGLPMAGGAAAADASLDMAVGRFYPIVMEVDLNSTAPVQLEWTAPHGVRYVIPRALLFLPTAS